MSSLSNRDFYNELGKNIFLYPFNAANIKEASINLSASEYAWNVDSEQRIKLSQDKDRKFNTIVIPSNTPVLIMTLEAIYVTNKICGTYHSRVSMVSKGLGHISTTLDPGYYGASLISIINNAEKPIEIMVGEPIVSIMFSYVNKEALLDNNKRPNPPHQNVIIAPYEGNDEDNDKFMIHTRNTDYLAKKEFLIEKMKSDPEFTNWKKAFLKEDKILQKEYNRKKWFLKIVAIIFVLLLLAVIFILIIDYILKILGQDKTFNAKDILIPLLIAIVSLIPGIFMLSFSLLKNFILPLIEKKADNKNGKE